MPRISLSGRRRLRHAPVLLTVLLPAFFSSALMLFLPPQPVTVYLLAAFVVLMTALTVTLIRLRRKMLKAAETHQRIHEMRARFLSAISHDIRTPLNTMIGLAAIAAGHTSDEAQQIRLKRIRLAGEHLLTLVNDILDVTRMESGKLHLKPAEMSLPEMFSQLVSMMVPQMQDKHLHLEVLLRSIRHEHVVSDKLRVSQIYVNLLSNAIKYTPPNGQIVLELWEEEGETALLCCRITDSGTGMDASFMAQMYDAFERGSDARVLASPGTGMGLYIVRQMVDLLGGDITCSSRPEEGTSFEVRLPVTPLQESARSLPPLHLLLAEGSPEAARLARNTLVSLGAQAETALNAPAALRVLRTRRASDPSFDAVIVDRRLPGLQLSTFIETVRSLTPPPRILLADFEGTDTETACRTLGADGFISKLYFPGDVCRAVSALFAPSPRREESALDLAGMRLLIAEDLDANRDILTEMLHLSGAECDQAVNGQMCVNLLKKAGPGVYDAVLMDLQMPVMDGLTAARLIRSLEDPLLRATPIIAVSADAYQEDVDACLQAGMNGHLAKPITPESLVQTLSQYAPDAGNEKKAV